MYTVLYLPSTGVHNDTFAVLLQPRCTCTFSLPCRLLKSDPSQLFEKLEIQARYVHVPTWVCFVWEWGGYCLFLGVVFYWYKSC